MTQAPIADPSDGRLRIAYLSADFRTHVNGHLTKRLFELHDRARFEIIGISYGPDDGSALRARIIRAFDRFHDVSFELDRSVAELIRKLGVHIAVDLTGHTTHGRSGILASRPAPIQVSYLGFLGTMGADFIDYIIGDRIALPFEQQPFYTEKIVHLPDCFLVTDDEQEIGPVPTRSAVGLPDEAFVFCSFNNSYKLQPDVFDAWMRILHRTENSVLWLYKENEQMQENLCAVANERGIDRGRLVFAAAEELPKHLARQQLADLFLDTTPYNVGGTGIAALWAGVPILTTVGSTFVGRMAASMLHSIGLPELATVNLAEYEALAIKLASDRSLMRSLRAKLHRNRTTHPLFQTDRFRRHLESAYDRIWEHHRNGRAAEPFAVEAR